MGRQMFGKFDATPDDLNLLLWHTVAHHGVLHGLRGRDHNVAGFRVLQAMRQPVARLEGNQAISHSNHGQAERREVRNGLRP